MTPNQVELVQISWSQVAPIAKQAAELFYGRLFELKPEYRSMFKGDIEEQGKKLMTVLATVVQGLKNFDKLQGIVWQLGRRHVQYGVSNADYAPVAEALIWTLKQGLGDQFTAETEQAWVAAYTVLAGLMQAGAESEYANFDYWLANQ